MGQVCVGVIYIHEHNGKPDTVRINGTGNTFDRLRANGDDDGDSLPFEATDTGDDDADRIGDDDGNDDDGVIDTDKPDVNDELRLRSSPLLSFALASSSLSLSSSSR